jgi:hypothetical protein
MDRHLLKALLEEISAGRLGVEAALERLKHLPYEDLEFARVDHHRQLRSGVPEVVYAEGKAPEQAAAIARALHAKAGRALVTRASSDVHGLLADMAEVEYDAVAGLITLGPVPAPVGQVAVIAAGTSDLPVAREAVGTLAFLGSGAVEITDVGVAGIHRLMHHRDAMGRAHALIVVAGMEGALPSVVGGLTDKPIVAVPTSVGYGTSFGGLTALFAMLNSCVPGIAVMNIDNGFGAACLAHRINRLASGG